MRESLPVEAFRDLVRTALAEDVGPGDVTTRATVGADARGRGRFLAKADCVVCGLDVVREVFAQLSADVVMSMACADGTALAAGQTLAEIEGPAAALLTGERTALNFLQYLSGIATVTRAYVEAAGPRLTVLDTRKTTPMLRTLAKYAVRCGGGTNHRTGLYDGILIKDNHIRLAGGIGPAVERARVPGGGLRVEVETQSMAEVDEAIAAGADVVMLDNLDETAMREAIRRIGGRALVELSGNMTLDRVRRLADSGADFVSVGALTHSAPAADISLELSL